MTFDASATVQGTASPTELLTPASTPYGTYFPQATFASAAITDPQQYAYFSYSATEQINWGFYSPNNNMVLSNGERIFQFPLSYGGSWSDDQAGLGAQNGQSLNRSGTTTGNYDGHGTLLLPFGTFSNVARVTMTEDYSDLVAGVLTIDYHIEIVSYMKPGIPVALFTSTILLADFGNGMDTLTTYSTLVDPTAISVPEHEGAGAIAGLFPNPASDRATLLLSDRVGPAHRVRMFDPMGREVLRPMGGNVASGSTLELDLAGLSAGMYTVRVEEEGRISTARLTVQ